MSDRRPPSPSWQPYPPALVYGPPAAHISACLDEHLDDFLDKYGVTGDLRARILRQARSIGWAGDAFAAGQHAAVLGAPTRSADSEGRGSSLRHDDRHTLREAARIMTAAGHPMGPERVRQLCADGRMGRRLGDAANAPWVVTDAEIATEIDRRRQEETA